MTLAPLRRFLATLVRSIGIWYVPGDMQCQEVAHLSVKKWGDSTKALEHLLQKRPSASNVVCASCMLWSKIESAHPLSEVRILQNLLERLPVHLQAETLQQCLEGNIERAALILSQLTPPVPEGLFPVAYFVAQQWRDERRCDELALKFFQSLQVYGVPQEEILWLLARIYMSRNIFSQAEFVLQQLARLQPTAEVWWYLALMSQALQKPPLIVVELLSRCISSTPPESRTDQALRWIGAIARQFVEGRFHREGERTNHAHRVVLEKLRTILEAFPLEQRARACGILCQNDEVLTAELLTLLVNPPIAGLSSLAFELMQRWSTVPRHDNIALQFFYFLPSYGIPAAQAHLLLGRALVARGLFSEAEQVLVTLAQSHATPDILWLLHSVYQALDRSPQLQIETLCRFIEQASGDSRLAEAWNLVGNLYTEQAGHGMDAIRSYLRAEKLGLLHIPALSSFREGDWQSIPALRAHADFAFPVVVAIDIEVDPRPGAKPGDRIYEVAAVRMKGCSVLCEYYSYIRRPFRPLKLKDNSVIEQAPVSEQVALELRGMLDGALVVGHNIRDFDAEQLAGLGVPIVDDQIVDTLHLARLLYPDSLRHNLSLLCKIHGIDPDAEAAWHTALKDALACGLLLQALGDEFLQRGQAFLNGVRALVAPDSAFDRAILQPRSVGATPSLAWSLDPEPSRPHMLVALRGSPASPAMQEALQSGDDALVELRDTEAAYIRHLPTSKRALVTTSTRSRLEDMLAAVQTGEEVYVLPDPTTQLCPHRLRSLIEKTDDADYRLLLFCLYQLSHNHDAGTLFPMRLPIASEPAIVQLRRDLLRSCCRADAAHSADCPAARAYREAITSHRILLATHEAIAHQKEAAKADLIVIDDIVELNMHLAPYLALQLQSERIEALRLTPEELNAIDDLRKSLADCAQTYSPYAGFHERLPLRSVKQYLEDREDQAESALAHLERAGATTERLARAIRRLFDESTSDSVYTKGYPARADVAGIGGEEQGGHIQSKRLRAYWLDIWFADQDGRRTIERWAMNGLNLVLEEAFTTRFWSPYQQHILCGPALTVDTKGPTHLERSLGLSRGLPLLKDTRAPSRIYIPPQHVLAPAGYLRRFSWALQLGALLYSLQDQLEERSLIITLNQSAITEALARAFTEIHLSSGRQVLASPLGWTMAKIDERLADHTRRVLTLVAPRIRSAFLNRHADVEITGPLGFLNHDDPLVGAHMRAFAERYPEENPFRSYLLPQALLELKTRLSSDADLHIILDSRLYAKSYRDEVYEMLRGLSIQEDGADPLLQTELPEARWQERAAFLAQLSQALQQRGLGESEEISDEELRLVLRRFWNHADFKTYEKRDGAELVSQLTVVRGVLEERDQLLVAATGGGKSLCYQLPALIFAEQDPPKVTVVFSPLIALMSDQVEELHNKGIFSAIMLNSSLSAIQRQEHLEGLARGDYSIVYVAPEQIHSSAFRRAIEQREIGLIAVDEAHCLSQWGHDFRTDYFSVKDWIDRIAGESGRTFPILALTATARLGHRNLDRPELSDEMSTVRDIIEKLKLVKRSSNSLEAQQLKEQEAILTSPRRSELEFRIEQIVPEPVTCKCGKPLAPESGQVVCPACQVQTKWTDIEVGEFVEKVKLQRLVRLLLEPGAYSLLSRWQRPLGERQRGIIYCAYTATTETVANSLKERGRDAKLRVDFYHAERTAEDKNLVLQRFKSNGEDGLDVVVATNAFGMGIDVRRIGFVIHFDVPGTPEAYYQEAGRAGRDEYFKGQEKAISILLYHPVDLGKQRYLNRQHAITSHQVLDMYEALCEIRPPLLNHSDEQREQEIIFTPQEIAVRAGVSEEQVGMLLYYLEYHTKLDGKRVLERGDTANHILQLRFEKGYLSRCSALPAHSSSYKLLECFQNDGAFGLSEDATITISLKELAAHLHCKIGKLERELLNLVQRRIVTYLCQGRVGWAKDADAARRTLIQLKRDILKLLTSIDRNGGKRAGALLRGETVFEDLSSCYAQLGLQAVPQKNLWHFLSALSHRGAGDLRLFNRFTRSAKRSHPGRYELRLLLDAETTLPERLDDIFSSLQGTLLLVEQQQRIESTAEEDAHVQTRSVELDLLKIEPDYGRRQRLHRQLLLLDTLGVLKYTGDPSLGLAMRVTLKQAYAPAARLEIDLGSLHLKEMHEKHKLKLMERYATETAERSREEEFTSYFFGTEPLVKPVGRAVRADLSEEQRAVLGIEKGFHLIEGPAGCGKTTALVEYIKHLVYQRCVPLERIMVTTHFNSATNRIAKELESLQEYGSVLFSTTINKFGEMIFRKYRLLLLREDGKPYYEREPQLLQGSQEHIASEEQTVVRKALERIHAGTWQDSSWPIELERVQSNGSYQPSDELERRCLSAITLLRQHGIFPTSQVTRKQLVEVLGKDKEDSDFLSLRYAVYLEFLKLRGVQSRYTFDDQILFALAILSFQPIIAREYQHFFEQVIVDELQDFTLAQAKLLLALCPEGQNVLAFGDRHQEIRVKETSADSVFDRFARLASSITHQLTQNYRSTQSILNLISFVRNFGETQKFSPLLAVNKEEGELPAIVRLVQDREQENKRTASAQRNSSLGNPQIERMVEAARAELERIPESDRGSVAFIAMKSNLTLPIERYLRSRGIGFAVLDEKPLYQKHHVNRVLVYLRLIANRMQNRDIEQLLRFNLVPYFEYEQVQMLMTIATYSKLPLYMVLERDLALRKARVTAEQRLALQKHLALISNFETQSDVAKVIEELRALENGPFSMVQDQEQKREDIERALEGLANKTVADAATEIEQHLTFLERDQQHSGLFVTSIDHAKSEEFDTVFLLGPDYLEAAIPPRHFLSFKRRFYVGISRARKRLFLIVGDHQPNSCWLLSAIERQPNLCRIFTLSPKEESSEVLA